MHASACTFVYYVRACVRVCERTYSPRSACPSTRRLDTGTCSRRSGRTHTWLHSGTGFQSTDLMDRPRLVNRAGQLYQQFPSLSISQKLLTSATCCPSNYKQVLLERGDYIEHPDTFYVFPVQMLDFWWLRWHRVFIRKLKHNDNMCIEPTGQSHSSQGRNTSHGQRLKRLYAGIELNGRCLA